MIQEIIAFGILLLAVAFLFRKFLFKKKNKHGCDKGCCP
ncbi:MAG: FeoB-associated Cys-rich membrane protein [Flavobacterium sp.]|nr:MAG: FeoB-associated Cys-rich membrane protein [Flavobacterium sp.]